MKTQRKLLKSASFDITEGLTSYKMCQLHMKMYKRQQQRLYTTSKRWRSTKKSDKSDPSGGGEVHKMKVLRKPRSDSLGTTKFQENTNFII